MYNLRLIYSVPWFPACLLIYGGNFSQNRRSSISISASPSSSASASFIDSASGVLPWIDPGNGSFHPPMVIFAIFGLVPSTRKVLPWIDPGNGSFHPLLANVLRKFGDLRDLRAGAIDA